VTIVFLGRFHKDGYGLPKAIQKKLDKVLEIFRNNYRHPSLQTKKLPGTDFWYARVDRAYRFTYQIEGETIILRRVGTHDILNRERD